MNIKMKTLFIIGFMSTLCLLIGFNSALRYNYVNFCLLIAGLGFITYLLIDLTILKKITALFEKNISEKNALREQSESDQLLINNKIAQYQQEKLAKEKLEAEIYNLRNNAVIQNSPANNESLPNRMIFHAMLGKAINHVKRRKQILAVLLLNIDLLDEGLHELTKDEMDAIHDELSHRFSHTLRSEDIVANLNSNQFVILLNDIIKPKFASTVAQKLLRACKDPILTKNNTYYMNANIGIAIYPQNGDISEKLLENADLALYQAKHEGQYNYQFFTKEMNEEAKEFMKLESALKKAIEEKQFTLYYQPKLHLKKGSIVGVEALIRWEHPELGLVTPSDFIPLAEETGLIFPISEWALKEACRINKYWQDKGYEHITMALNLSPKQFHQVNITEIINSALTETGLNAGFLELEITEKTIMQDTENALVILNKMKELGVRLSLDHFGTGYTSIGHLKQFPVNTLKIDNTFIKGVPENPNDCAITNAMIALAHNLGFEIVAEGVETAEQVQFLSDHQCDIVQGYFLGHPMPADKIEQQFKKLRIEVILP